MARFALLVGPALLVSFSAFAACVGDDAPASTGPTVDGGVDGTTPTVDGASSDGATSDGSAAAVAAVDVAAGRDFACAALADGTVACWGKNDVGQTGQPIVGGDTCSGAPCRRPTRVAGLTDVVAVGAGAVSACAVTRDGAVSCWGQNDSAQLGHPTANDATCGNVRCNPQPTVVANVSATSVAVGTSSACAVLKTGAVACWGQNGTGQLGRGSFAAGGFPAAEVNGLSEPVTAIAVDAFGNGHWCALVKSGQVHCWGRNSAKEVSDTAAQQLCNANQEYCIPTPTRVLLGGSPLDGVTSISASDGATCASRTNATPVCWGYAGHALFDAVSGESLAATPKASAGNIGKLSGNFTHVCGVDQGTVKCWGENPRGGLGVAPSVTTDTCVQGKCSTKLVTVAGVQPKVLVAGTYATFAVTMAGEVLGWGTNDFGTLGEPPQVGQNECAAPCSPTPRTISMPK